MKIPYLYWIEHWFKFSIASLALGCTLGMALWWIMGNPNPSSALVPCALSIAIFIVADILSVVLSTRGGPIVYGYILKELESDVARIVYQYLGFKAFCRYKLMGLKEEDFQKILSSKSLDCDNSEVFSILIKTSFVAHAAGDINKELRLLKVARTMLPKCFLVNYRMALCYESLNNAQEAICCYQKAQQDPNFGYQSLIDNMETQIQRIEQEGRTQAPPPDLGQRLCVWT